LDDAAVGIVREAGFSAACTSLPGTNDPGTLDHLLRRIEIRGDTTLHDFALMVRMGTTRVRHRLWRGG
ncbi:MAG: hypothetical protein H0W67_10680, partial [Gemmatimonadales bacterium]|nr:hypothetical protein [Gemmatimonadales bacterium]